ncbi:hypothetical protein DO97_12500 [Neosynechococcus sphagnicola sy1]|uniref:tRNA uridine(34) hydroxylase n=1 Tax=Neosynechococcus sphagnicola sy1 TaxID=1497020 RepID=A0A098TJS4_9CYAN|nr:rhodanese-related sulfurtransferase [Neosynechococcus sphagnicola]KGF72077.1 hypothetical protein DO97_12500 [Neosynechococcus sphagnicola sy1]
MSAVVATFYKFVRLADFAEKQQPLLTFCQEQAVKGTILLAAEGINGTIWGTPQAVTAVLDWLRSDLRLHDLVPKIANCQVSAFERMKVRLKQEIVTLGIPEVDPSHQVGTYVSPQNWNDLITDPDVTVIDTRNDYEVNIGSFEGAIDPQTQSFRDFPEYVRHHLDPAIHLKVALFCTGGIRCEKATAWMLEAGFKEVYHLQGGILKYLEEVPAAESLWQGECFVFDQRVAVQQGLKLGSHQICRRCGRPIAQPDPISETDAATISCPHCEVRVTPQPPACQSVRQPQYP